MLTVVTFKWSTPGYRSEFGPQHVATLARMVARNFRDPHRFVLFSDTPEADAEALADTGIEVFRLWDDLREVKNPSGSRNPSCFVRLKLFARNVAEWLGPRIVWLDLDCVVTGDLRPVWNRPEDFIIWGGTNNANPYNGSMVLFSAGARPQLWEEFDPQHSPAAARQRGFFGSDQGWIAYRLGRGEKRWTGADGVYSFRNQIEPRAGYLPMNARIVFFHGRVDPWHREAQRYAWVKEHYR
jgi:hypothetical protein